MFFTQLLIQNMCVCVVMGILQKATEKKDCAACLMYSVYLGSAHSPGIITLLGDFFSKLSSDLIIIFKKNPI